MGLPVRVAVYTGSARGARTAARAAFDRIAALDRALSDYRPDSELRRLEHRPREWISVSRELFSIVARALEISRATGGAFDPSVGPLVALWRQARTTGRLPDRITLEAARALVDWRQIQLDHERRAVRLAMAGMRLDLGGIAKGFIIHEAMRTLRSRGVTRALIEAGGDIVVGDPPPGCDGWRIETAGADRAFTERASRLANASIATSGATVQFVEVGDVRYSHVIDPRTGLGVTAPFLARVIAADGATADALATALTVLGPERVSDIGARFPHVLASVTSSFVP